MTELVSEVTEDGTQVVEASAPTNYEMELDRLDGSMPESPPIDSLSKLFKPKYVLKVKLPDGEIFPFIYKRIDPGTLMITEDQPIAVDISTAKTAQEIQKRKAELDQREKLGQDLTPEEIDEYNEFFQHPDTVKAVKNGLQVKKNTVIAGTISPQITEDLYDELDDDILEALYEAITGGVTSSNELVEHFRDNS